MNCQLLKIAGSNRKYDPRESRLRSLSGFVIEAIEEWKRLEDYSKKRQFNPISPKKWREWDGNKEMARLMDGAGAGAASNDAKNGRNVFNRLCTGFSFFSGYIHSCTNTFTLSHFHIVYASIWMHRKRGRSERHISILCQYTLYSIDFVFSDTPTQTICFIFGTSGSASATVVLIQN